MPKKSRLPRPENTRWLKYAIAKGYINPVPATGTVLRRNGEPYTEYTNPFGYKYIQVSMHCQNFSFYVHKCIYIKIHGEIPKGKELNHDDSDLSNNKGSNIIARTMLQNLRKRRKPTKPEPAF